MLPALPATLAPPAPFPLVLEQSSASEFVAPGIRRATYRLQTQAGPLVVNVVALDLHEPTVHLGAVVANDTMISSGETVSSMARRSGAVAGVNADYFDIGNTNQPLNVVVRDGALLRTPSKRIVADVRTDRTLHFDTFAFAGAASFNGANVPLTGVNEWPPQGGVSLLTPAYGMLKPFAGVTVVELVPADPAHVVTRIAGTYRVVDVDDAPPSAAVDGPLLAFGPAAKAIAPPPAVRDSVTLSASTNPALDDVVAAVGGGPLLLANGGTVDDPNAPAPEERDRRFPVSGAATTPHDVALLIAVDGRDSQASIGLTRPEFGALMLGLGATDGMAFDSGGSATLVARVLGDVQPSVLNAPSDGEERRVADGLFAYSTAPLGPPAQLVVRPARVVALPHARVPVRLALVDAAGHALGAAHADGGDVVRAAATSSTVVLRAANFTAPVDVDVVDRLARLDIVSAERAPEAGALVPLRAAGFDAKGRPVELGDAVTWTADRGRFLAPGTYRAAAVDARVVARAGGVSAQYTLRIGRHREAVPLFDAARVSGWHATTAAGVSFDAQPPSLRLAYDFSGGARRAAADGAFALPGEPLAFSVDVAGNRSGVAIRAAFINRFGERVALTLARNVDWDGWQTRSIALPADLNPPVQLAALAVEAGASSPATGSIAFRNASVTLAGSR